jgi:hypothetical protein
MTNEISFSAIWGVPGDSYGEGVGCVHPSRPHLLRDHCHPDNWHCDDACLGPAQVDHRGSLIGLVTASASVLLLRDSILPPAAFPCVLCVRLLPSTDIDDCATSRERVQHARGSVTGSPHQGRLDIAYGLTRRKTDVPKACCLFQCD